MVNRTGTSESKITPSYQYKSHSCVVATCYVTPFNLYKSYVLMEVIPFPRLNSLFGYYIYLFISLTSLLSPSPSILLNLICLSLDLPLSLYLSPLPLYTNITYLLSLTYLLIYSLPSIYLFCLSLPPSSSSIILLSLSILSYFNLPNSLLPSPTSLIISSNLNIAVVCHPRSLSSLSPSLSQAPFLIPLLFLLFHLFFTCLLSLLAPYSLSSSSVHSLSFHSVLLNLITLSPSHLHSFLLSSLTPSLFSLSLVAHFTSLSCSITLLFFPPPPTLSYDSDPLSPIHYYCSFTSLLSLFSSRNPLSRSTFLSTTTLSSFSSRARNSYYFLLSLSIHSPSHLVHHTSTLALSLSTTTHHQSLACSKLLYFYYSVFSSPILSLSLSHTSASSINLHSSHSRSLFSSLVHDSSFTTVSSFTNHVSASSDSSLSTLLSMIVLLFSPHPNTSLLPSSSFYLLLLSCQISSALHPLSSIFPFSNDNTS
ncbi:hypothetical protein C7M84_009790 [Penaeus vannamei]|uniref:Uncharacterized protein n=1 Tax=Penaeus vannamei TaxID=6689 RepID=A0A423UA94_PENVA|nr:hypothetical protein C7M84_009790 [Penaeus vannamei]